MRFIPLLFILTCLAACSSGGGSGDPGELIQLPKTGQVTTYKAGDDGALQKGVAWPSPRFVDGSDGTVTDRLTGLVWLKNATCIGKKSWSDALVASNALASGACGLSDGSKAGSWRLPNINELNSLVNAGRWNPAVGPLTVDGNPEALLFSMTANANYWSSTTTAALTTQAWSVHFMFGLQNPAFKPIPFMVWPVKDGSAAGAVRLARTGQSVSHATGDDGAYRKGAVWPTPRFIDNGNGTVTDNLTRLVWLKNANCVDIAGGVIRNQPNYYSVLTYEKTLAWVSGLAAGSCGLSDGSKARDWRLPNRLEMQSLMDYSRDNPALPPGHPFANVQAQGVWTSTALSYSSTSGQIGATSWFLYPESGLVNVMSINGDFLYLWAVRDSAQ